MRSFIKEVHDVQIQLVENKTNSGFALAHNQAIRLTDTDFVLVLNPDVFLEPNYLICLIQVMEQKLELGSITGKLVLQNNHGIIDSTGLVVNRIWRAFDRGAGESVNLWMDSAEVFGVLGAASYVL